MDCVARRGVWGRKSIAALALCSMIALSGHVLLGSGLVALVLLGVTTTTLIAAASLLIWRHVNLSRNRQACDLVQNVLAGSDDAALLTCGTDMQVLWHNDAFPVEPGDGGTAQPLLDLLGHHVADPRELALHLMRAALRDGVARHESGEAGGHVPKLTARHLGQGLILWRIRVEDAMPFRSAEADPASGVNAPLPILPDVLDELRLAMIRINRANRVTNPNSHAEVLLGAMVRDAPVLNEIFDGPGRPVLEWLEELRQSDRAVTTEVLRAMTASGERYVQVALHKLRGTDNLLAVLTDATEYKSLEEKLTQSQKMQAVGQLAGGVAHDFNNLLTAISGHCELLLLRRDRGDPDYPDLLQIQQNTYRAAAVVRQLLAFSRKQTLALEVIDLGNVLGELTHLLNRLVGEKVTLFLRPGSDKLAIRSDRRQFEQIMVNLVINARDAMPDGGVVRLEMGLRHMTDATLRGRVMVPPGQYAVIRIIDDGIGIPPAHLDKIFEPFFTTKRPGEGTGLGLSTVYGLVKQMGGFIFYDSTEGTGTVVELLFRAQDPAHIAPREDKAAQLAMGRGADRARRHVVLLAEDEESVRAFAASAIRLQGHEVIEVSSGEAALELLEDPTIRPDLFVSDMIMPGLDGPGWVRKARANFPTTPVIFMSGYAEEALVEAQEPLGRTVFLPKPFSLSEFCALVSAQLQEHSKAA